MSQFWNITKNRVSPVLTAFLGGYLFTWGVTTLTVVSLVFAGVDYHEAETGALLLAFLVFLAVFLWRFASQRPGRVLLILFGGGALLNTAAYALQQLIIH